jgi:hypothetical protein
VTIRVLLILVFAHGPLEGIRYASLFRARAELPNRRYLFRAFPFPQCWRTAVAHNPIEYPNLHIIRLKLSLIPSSGRSSVKVLRELGYVSQPHLRANVLRKLRNGEWKVIPHLS